MASRGGGGGGGFGGGGGGGSGRRQLRRPRIRGAVPRVGSFGGSDDESLLIAHAPSARHDQPMRLWRDTEYERD